MKKILNLFLLMVFLAGCVVPSLEETQTMAKESLNKLRAELQSNLGIDEYNMQVGDYVTVDGKIVRLLSYNSDYVTEFDVDGTTREMRETQDTQIINNLELTILRFKYDATDLSNSYVTARIKKFVPKTDEYLMYLGDSKEILGHTIKLDKLEKDGTVSLMIDSVNSLRIMKDKTETISDIYVSNVRPNYRAIASERYAIVKITGKS
jgi:hypothetical protein